ncbi:glycosyl transferase [Paractinoplanes deccanensis]|uniref:Glycosyl transferase n=1 Tax=Paractinoplanes deccanensis TaxID=113561 RepID=A0ABQ3YB58_9ACTN|nr:glycosyltransferase family 2 protein [Actinoplanes deccanensis]GID77241.1 glycosyl transferase [Actinoplanes deccanensis]
MPAKRRRQWGADRRTQPLPPVAAPASDTLITMGRLGIVVTLLAWAAYIVVTVISQFVNRGFQGMRFTSETVVYVAIMSLLTMSSLLYLVARQGALYRTRAHRRVPRAVVDEAFDDRRPPMTVLVPSYREQVPTIRKTLLSAALQEYPDLRVVLLLDDPPHPTRADHVAGLVAARALPGELTEWLREPRERFARLQAGEIGDLIDEYRWAADWLRRRAAEELIEDHVDRFFAEQVLGALAKDFDGVAGALASALDEGESLPDERKRQLCQRLTWTFRCEITSFERKRYASLSHEANKAMNLNSYIGLMGRSYEVRETPEGTVLVPSPAGTMTVPDAEFILTLDADSILLPEYCLRLVYLFFLPDNHRLAVAQTPYSAFPGSSTRMERLAGATTDLQHIVHQGMSYHDATFWVGANAVIRKRALDDIVEVEHASGHEVRRYVQDRTVIEDTESSLDLAIHGWRLINYPERLSYSATPPDFGSLAIQRRRWANGGLLILPKLWRNSRERTQRGEHGSAAQTWLRVNYMASTCWSSIGLILLLAYPFDSKLLSPLIVLAALPYFLAMASDLKRLGYKRTDILRIYGFNLILLPVNLAGVVKSLQQAVTGKKIPFARTPKVADRTATSLLFAVSPLLVIAFSVYTVWRDVQLHNWGNAAFATLNALAAAYAVVAFMGVRNTIVDLWLGFVEHLYVPEPSAKKPVVRRRRRTAPEPAPAPWQEILYRGAAATATGAYHAEASGSFHILASPPAAPPQHNRRASDRQPGRAGTADETVVPLP